MARRKENGFSSEWQLPEDLPPSPGIYRWDVIGAGTYIGKAKNLRRRLSAYPNNVRRLLAGLPYRSSKPDGYRSVHRALADALAAGTLPTCSVVEQCEISDLSERERYWISELGTINGSRPSGQSHSGKGEGKRMPTVTGAGLAREAGVEPKSFRKALRAAGLQWHQPNAPWLVERGSPEHQEMAQLLAALTVGPKSTGTGQIGRPSPKMSRQHSDEHYVIDLCDEVLGQRALRGHRFAFLRGDASAGGIGRPLPVDAYYPALGLVVEYCEKQHSEPVAFFDSRVTVSGVGRGEQRKIYDQRRRDVLPQNGIAVVELTYVEFAHNSQKRLLRQAGDQSVVKRRLKAYGQVEILAAGSHKPGD